jgi:SpoVK/Ycf46/Vps4 family AAA+-type ATPase
LLTGTGKLIRHIDVQHSKDYRNADVENLVKEAIQLAIREMSKPTKAVGMCISKISQ